MVAADSTSSGGYTAARPAPFDRAADAMLICDDRRRFVDLNAATCLLMRLERVVVLDHRIDDLLFEEARRDLDAAWAAFLQLGRPIALAEPGDELVLPDGVRIAATLSVSKLARDRHLATIGFQPARELSGRRASCCRLTEREREILSLVARGKTGAKIATQLFLSPTTVQTHVNNALVKLDARNRPHAVALALQAGEIDIDDAPEQCGGGTSLRRRDEP